MKVVSPISHLVTKNYNDNDFVCQENVGHRISRVCIGNEHAPHPFSTIKYFSKQLENMFSFLLKDCAETKNK